MDEIGVKVAVAGEKEFKEALKGIESGLKVNASAMNMLTAKYADNEKSVEALTAKGKALENTLSSQKEKVDKIREALTASAQKYGEADKRTMKWQTELNNAEAALFKLDNELKKNNTQLEDANKSMQEYGSKADEVAANTDGLGGKIVGLSNYLGINLPAGAETAISALDRTKLSTVALVGVVAGMVTGLGKLTISTAKAADDILTLSKVTGMSTDTIQEMNYAAELVDVSTDTMTGAMRKMIRSMDDARGGGKDAAEAFRHLHVSITNNGQLKDSEQMFYDVIDALGKMKNETEKDALAMQIFGKSAQELNPLIDVGSKALKEYAAQAQAMGYVLGPETLEKFGKLDDAMQTFNNQTVALKGVLAQALLPVMIVIFDLLSKMDPKLLASIAIIGTMAAVAITVVKAVKSVVDIFKPVTAVTEAASAATTIANAKWMKTIVIIVGVVAALIALAAIIAVIVGKGEQLNSTMNNIGGSIGNMTSTINGAGNQVNVGRNALGTNSWRGGLTWVGENGPELLNVPSGSQIYNNKKSREMVSQQQLGGGSSTQNNNIYVNANNLRQMSDVVNLMERQRQYMRAR